MLAPVRVPRRDQHDSDQHGEPVTAEQRLALRHLGAPRHHTDERGLDDQHERSKGMRELHRRRSHAVPDPGRSLPEPERAQDQPPGQERERGEHHVVAVLLAVPHRERRDREQRTRGHRGHPALGGLTGEEHQREHLERTEERRRDPSRGLEPERQVQRCEDGQVVQRRFERPATVAQVREQVSRAHERRDADLVDPEALASQRVDAQEQRHQHHRDATGQIPPAEPSPVRSGQLRGSLTAIASSGQLPGD